jgi:ribosomal protein S27AE
MMNSQDRNRCPRCGEGRLRSWHELSDEEREVVRRLPASADYTQDERTAKHRWCTRCWQETEGQEEKG